MEIVIALFIGAWLCLAGILGYFQLKKDYKDVIIKNSKNEDKK